MGKSSNSALVILAFFAIYVIWGSTYLLNKIAVMELPPFMLASCRFITAGLLIFALAKSMGISLKITKRQLWNTIIAGVLFLSFGNGVVVWALRYVDSGFAALEISAQPLIILLLMYFLQGKKIQPMSLVGVFLGIIGIYLLVSQKQIIAQESSIVGMIMIFFLHAQLGLLQFVCLQGRFAQQLLCEHGISDVYRGNYLGFDEFWLWRTMDLALAVERKGAIVHGVVDCIREHCRIHFVQLFVKSSFPRKSGNINLCEPYCCAATGMVFFG